MAQTHQPDDDEGAWAAGAGGGAARTPAPGDETAATAALPPVIGAPGGQQTPGRGTAAPLGTVGDGRYRMTHRLGRGGMAEVFAAQDVRLGRTVAVKLLRSDLAQDDVARLRFTREAHSVAALNHHSIVSVYDTGEELVGEESTPYIVMELVEGRTVRELLVDEEAPPVDQALIIIAGVLEALAYSHRHGIVHRDIKPANVIITTGGAVKVMDFGIARALTGAATTMTQTGMVMGTPQYLSPEQALGKPVDHRSDLYAAGCMLYELLTLRPPFTGDTPLSVVYQHVQDPPVPPSHANPRVPTALDPLVLRSLAKNPDDRFQDADEFRAHLQHALREMHGAAGAGWVAGSAAAGLAAIGQGGRGGDSGELPTPYGGTAGSDPTAVLPYQVPGGHTPATPYQGAGGPYGGGGGGHHGHGGGGGDDDRGRRRRGPLAWIAGIAAVVVASGVGVALALSGNGKTPDTTPTTPPVVSTAPTTAPTTTGTVPSPTGTVPTTSTATRRPQQPTDNNQSPPATMPGTRTPTPTGTATGTRTPTATGTGTGSPTAGTSPSGTTKPTGGATATQTNPAPTTPAPGGGGGGAPR
ncbi:protein kinase domain-containing protein [Kitasatospora sp. NPDC054939]